MANHKSSLRRARNASRRAKRNQMVTSKVKTFEKKLRAAIASKNGTDAQKFLVEFMSQADKAAQKGVLHVNNAARRVARLSQQVHAIVKGK